MQVIIIIEGLVFQAQNKGQNLHLLSPLVAHFSKPHTDASISALMVQLF